MTTSNQRGWQHRIQLRPMQPWRIDPQDWQRALTINVLGVVHGIQAFVPHLVTAGAGHVVNIASVAALTAKPFGVRTAPASTRWSRSSRRCAVSCR